MIFTAASLSAVQLATTEPASAETADVGVFVTPTVSLSVAGRSTACNGITPTRSATASALDLGRVTSAAPSSAAQDVLASANSRGGVSIQLRSTGTLDDSRGNSIASIPGNGDFANAQAFPLEGSPAFGYSAGWMGANKWVPAVLANKGLSNNPNPGSTGTCVVFQAQTSAATVAGDYATTVIYTAIPIF